jgi:hypothetical protein
VEVDVSEVVKVKEMTREVVGSFRRDDVRVRKEGGCQVLD